MTECMRDSVSVIGLDMMVITIVLWHVLIPCVLWPNVDALRWRGSVARCVGVSTV